jgi:ribosomal protein S18 acetylase RimI-like enzyme
VASNGVELEIREVRTRDFSALLCMMRKLAEQPPSLPFDEGKVRAALETFLSDSELGRAWLLHLGERSIGYVILTLGYSFEFQGRDAFIDELYIERECRRMGFGRRAIQFAEEKARSLGVNALHLEVDPNNDAAVELYRRAGYIDPGRRLMTKWLR